MKALVIGGAYDGQWMEIEKSPSNPLCTSKEYYVKHTFTFDSTDEKILVLTPYDWTQRQIFEALINSYRPKKFT